MSEDNNLVPYEDKPLMNIFQTQEDKNGTDVLAMSNFFELFVDDISERL